MTRDQAIQILERQWAACKDAYGLVTALESLGLLEFDEPINRAKAVLAKYGNSHVIMERLDAAGLKIVEK